MIVGLGVVCMGIGMSFCYVEVGWMIGVGIVFGWLYLLIFSF